MKRLCALLSFPHAWEEEQPLHRQLDPLEKGQIHGHQIDYAENGIYMEL